MAGFRGLTADENSEIAEEIKSGKVGGIILFDRDVSMESDIRNIESPAQVKKLISQLKGFAPTPLFVAVDQEGGNVCRLKERHGFKPTVSLEYIGQQDDIELTRKYARETAETLYDAGFNINLAPCVDLNLNPENPIIGSKGRSISKEVDKVVKHAAVTIDEYRKKNIIAALKHYPGHGSSTVDSHHGFVDVTDIWQLRELSTFRDLIEMDKADMIMTAHIFNSNYDKRFPTTLSKGWITGILRYGLDFKSVVISDDMQMKAITNDYRLEEAIELAVNAGVDILVFGNNVDYHPEIIPLVNDIIRRLVRVNRIRIERIENSFNRIMKLKEKYLNNSIKN